MKRLQHRPVAVFPLFLGLSLLLVTWASLAPTERVASAAVPVTAEPPHIIFVEVDSTRPDHLSVYGYERATTPQLQSLVGDLGARFTNAQAPSSWTFPSNAGMVTGRQPAALGLDWIDLASAIPESETTLAEALAAAGYRTAGFVTPYYAGDLFGFEQGYEHFQTILGEIGAAELNQHVTAWLDENWQAGDAPLFLYVYYYDPHAWYAPPAPYDQLYDSAYTGTLTAEVYGYGEPVIVGDIVPTERDIVHLEALYDGEITYWDDQFGALMADLETRGVLTNALILVTSDHGEHFGEHGKWAHATSLYEELLRVPLLMRYDGVIPAGMVITEPVTLLDLLPTLLDFAGAQTPVGVDGVSLAGLLQGGPAPAGRPLFSELDAFNDPEHPTQYLGVRHPLRAVRLGNWKYIHPVDLVSNDELYWLSEVSPFETDNLIAAEPAQAESLFGILEAYYGLLTQRLHLPGVFKE